MRAPHLLFVPVGRITFDQEAAGAALNGSLQALRTAGLQITAPDTLLLMPEDAEAWVRSAAGAGADLLLFQQTTFTDARFIAGVAAVTDLPIHIWGLPEPVVNGGRLKLNSLTGLNLAANTLTMRGRRFTYTYGRPDDPAALAALTAYARAAAIRTDLRALRIGVVGDPPPGFFNSGADETALAHQLGPVIERLDLAAVLAEATALADQDREALVADALARVSGGDDLPVLQVSRSAGFYAAMVKHVKSRSLNAVAIRCWPEFFEQLGAAACTAVSRLTDEGVQASCESDIHGALAMWVGSRLTDGPAYLGDLVHVDAERNSGIFWHCGASAYSLVNPRTGPVAGVHPNRKMALTLEVGLKPGRVTILRLAPGPAGYRLLVVGGEALDQPQKFWGTTVEVRTDRPVSEVLDTVIGQGFDHHYAVVWGDIRADLKALGALAGVEVAAM